MYCRRVIWHWFHSWPAVIFIGRNPSVPICATIWSIAAMMVTQTLFQSSLRSLFLCFRHVQQLSTPDVGCFTVRIQTPVETDLREWLQYADWYTVSLRECGQFRPCLHENFEKFEMISIPTGSWWSWWGRRRDRFQLPVGVEIISNFSKFSCRQGRNCPHSRWDTVYNNLASL